MSIATNLANLANEVNSQGVLAATKVAGGGGGGGPKITSIAVTDSSYTNIDDTSVGLGGGYIKITGSGFESGCQVLVGTVTATSVSYISSTEVRAQVPATAAGTYVVYLVNPDGGVAIRVNGINFSASPTWSTTSPLPSGAVNSLLSIQLSASSNGSVTYALQAGSTLPPNVTLSSSGLLSGTVSGIATNTTYNFTVVATDTELQDTPQAFSITIAVGDVDFKSTTLLLSGNATTFVRDASTNNFNVTVVGDARPSNLSPYSSSYATYGSGYFDGTGDYLTTTMPALGAGSFTVEFWFYPTDPTRAYLILDKAFRDGNFSLQTDYLNTGAFYLNVAGSAYTFSFTPPIVNQWNHIAISRNSSSLRFFLNGVQLGTTQTNSGSVTTGTLYIGGASTTGSGYLTTMGYMADLRLTITAVYTANFTPPTAPLTAITNTSLLTLQTNQPTNNSMFLDSGTLALPITRAGNATQGTFSPYGPNWSNYFDGTGDYLAAGNTTTNFGTSDFTIEAWFYKTGSGTTIVGNQDGGTDNNYFVFDAANAQATIQIRDGSGQAYAYGPAIVNNTWTHIAVSRASGSVRVFVNGVSGTPVTITKSVTSRITVVGAFLYSTFESYFTGYISNLRVIKGTAVYTSNFTPSTQPLTAITNTSLLTCASSRLIDKSTNNFTITRSGDVSVQRFSPFTPGNSYSATAIGGSIYLDGSGDYLYTPANSALNFGTGDLTLECWIYQTATSANTYRVILGDNVYGDAGGYTLYSYNNALNLWKGGSEVIAPAGTINLNAWTHVAWTRSGSSNRLFINGTQVGTTTTDATNYTSTASYIGASRLGTLPFSGYISDARIVKGTALYTSAFTPPTAPLTAIANTSLLLSGTGSGIVDNSMMSNLETIGDTRISTVQSKFGGSSIFFDGSGDYAVQPTNINFGYGTGDFTIEFWIYLNTVSADQTIVSNLSSASSVNPHIYYLNNTGIRYYTNNADRIIGSSLSPSTWYHIAVCRASGSTKMFINGTQTGSTYTDANNYGTSAPLGIGTYYSAGAPVTVSTLNGYIDDLRITRGVARYTANFTAPTSAHLLQ